MRLNDYGVRLGYCGTVRCEPEWSWHPPAESMHDFDLWFVWAGRGTLRSEAQTIDVQPGAMFLLRPGGVYHGEHDPKRRLGVCYVHFDFLDRHGRVTRPPPRELPPYHCRIEEVDFYENILRQVTQLADSRDALRRAQACRLFQAVLLGVKQRGTTPASPDHARSGVIASITRHIRENPGELFSVEALAARAGYSVDHFTRLFTKTTSQTPKEFCIRVRLDRARQLLRESVLGVEEIARTLGYADVFFFSRQFKQRVGVSPSQWRKTPG